MIARSIHRYIFFGTALRFLQDAEPGSSVHGDGKILANLEAFMEDLQEFNLPVTQRACGELLGIHHELAGTDADFELTPEQAFDLRAATTKVRLTLDAEAGGSIAHIVTDKRWDVHKLIGDVGSLMTPGVYDALPEVARKDFDEAGKCIAFERPTAAAFHLLRGTESVLRHFYLSVVRQKRLKTPMWGPMTDALRKRRSPPPAAMLNNLDNIRVHYRNPTQHPDKIYDIEEVQDLFPLCAQAVGQMVQSSGWRAIP